MNTLYNSLLQYILESDVSKVEFAKQHEGLNIEAGGKCGWFSTAKNMLAFMKTPGGSKLRKKYSEDLIKDIYKLATKETGVEVFDWKNCPITIVGKDSIVHIKRRYPEILDYVLSNRQKYNLKVTMELHDGFGTRAEKGLGYEVKLKQQIIGFLNAVAAMDDLDKRDLKDIINDSDYDDCVKQMYLGGAFNELIQLLKADGENINLDDIIQLTGGGDTQRNKNNEIINRVTFEFNSDWDDNMMINSGKIIADISIVHNNISPIYISVKLNESQLTGINIRVVCNKTVYNYTTNPNSTPEDLKSPEFDNIRNFIEAFGVSFEDLMGKYKKIEMGDDNYDCNLKLNSNYDPTVLGNVVQKMIGGNYWYAKPKGALYVKPNHANFEFKISSAQLSKYPSKAITIIVSVNNVACKFVLRTDGKDIFNKSPYRLFVVTNVNELIKNI